MDQEISLKEGHWLRIKDGSYAADKISSVFISKPGEPDFDWAGYLTAIFGMAPLALGGYIGIQTGSRVFALILAIILLLIYMTISVSVRTWLDKKAGHPRSVHLMMLGQEDSILVATVPEKEAKSMQESIDRILAKIKE